jgi:hypothetical protein
VIAAALLAIRREGRRVWTDSYGRMVWRMPPLDQVSLAELTPLTRIWLTVLRGYLVIASGLVFLAHSRIGSVGRLGGLAKRQVCTFKV